MNPRVSSFAPTPYVALSQDARLHGMMINRCGDINPEEHIGWGLSCHSAADEQCRGDWHRSPGHAYRVLHRRGDGKGGWLYNLSCCLVEESQRTCTLVSTCFEAPRPPKTASLGASCILPFSSCRAGGDVYNLVLWAWTRRFKVPRLVYSAFSIIEARDRTRKSSWR